MSEITLGIQFTIYFRNPPVFILFYCTIFYSFNFLALLESGSMSGKLES